MEYNIETLPPFTEWIYIFLFQFSYFTDLFCLGLQNIFCYTWDFDSRDDQQVSLKPCPQPIWKTKRRAEWQAEWQGFNSLQYQPFRDQHRGFKCSTLWTSRIAYVFFSSLLLFSYSPRPQVFLPHSLVTIFFFFKCYTCYSVSF